MKKEDVIAILRRLLDRLELATYDVEDQSSEYSDGYAHGLDTMKYHLDEELTKLTKKNP